MRFIVIILLFLTVNYASAKDEYFTSYVQNRPRLVAIIYNDEIVFQVLLNKRYVYTVPTDGSYTLTNGQAVYVKNGKISNIKTLKYNELFDLGLRQSAFFNQNSEECNRLKFFVAKNMLANDCQINFLQYQMLPIFPSFIRMIIASKEAVFNTKKCYKLQNTEEELLEIEAKTYQAIIDSKELETKQQAVDLTRDEKSDLKDAKKQRKSLKPWEFGVNDRDVILQNDVTKDDLGSNLTAFYISDFNEIGCIPFTDMKTISCNEYIRYKDALMPNYTVISENTDDSADSAIQINGIDVILHKKELLNKWSETIEQCDLKNIKFNN